MKKLDIITIVFSLIAIFISVYILLWSPKEIEVIEIPRIEVKETNYEELPDYYNDPSAKG